jgi:ribosome-binding protein aMBF1 (putative translation factor)
MGIAQRHIRIPFIQKPRCKKIPNPLQMNTLAVGDWIHANRIQKNLTLGHLAEKMGIARALVRVWENGTEEPDKKQLEIMVKIFGIACH